MRKWQSYDAYLSTPGLRAAPRVLDGLSDAAFARILRRLSFAEKAVLYDAVANTPPADPRERLLWFAQKERPVRFMSRFDDGQADLDPDDIEEGDAIGTPPFEGASGDGRGRSSAPTTGTATTFCRPRGLR